MRVYEGDNCDTDGCETRASPPTYAIVLNCSSKFRRFLEKKKRVSDSIYRAAKKVCNEKGFKKLRVLIIFFNLLILRSGKVIAFTCFFEFFSLIHLL